MLKQKHFPLEGDPYFRAVTFLYGTIPELDKVFKSYGMPLMEGKSGRYVTKMSNDGYHHDFIAIVRHDDKVRELAVLGHEVLHHTIFTMKRAGLKLSDKSEEAYTYYFEWMLRRCLKIMRGKHAST